MNIFVLDTNPVKAAKLLCDQHLNQMILESAQLLSTTDHLLYAQGTKGSPPSTELYKPTHPLHPCTLWLLESRFNCGWLHQHAWQMNEERSVRFSKITEHGSMSVIANAMYCIDQLHNHVNWKVAQQTPFKQVMPEEFKIIYLDQLADIGTVSAYKDYYSYKNKQWIKERGEKARMKWTNTSIPLFMKENESTT